MPRGFIFTRKICRANAAGTGYRQNFLIHGPRKGRTRSAARRADDACHIVMSLSEFAARVSAAGCALAEHQCQQSAEHDATEKQRPIGGLQGKKPSFAHNVRKHRQTRSVESFVGSPYWARTAMAVAPRAQRAVTHPRTMFGCITVTSPQQLRMPDRANAYPATVAAGSPVENQRPIVGRTMANRGTRQVHVRTWVRHALNPA
jgi:hypothetical protein